MWTEKVKICYDSVSGPKRAEKQLFLVLLKITERQIGYLETLESRCGLLSRGLTLAVLKLVGTIPVEK